MKNLLILCSLWLSQNAFAQEQDDTLKLLTQQIVFFNQIESFKEAAELVPSALAYFSNVTDTSLGFQFLMAAGDAAVGTGEDAQAVEYFRLASSYDSLNLGPKRALAFIYYRSGNQLIAIQYFKDILAIDSLAAGERSWLAKIYAEQGALQEALAVIRNRPRIHRNHYKLMALEARILVKMRQFYAAIPIFEELVVRKPNDMDLHIEFVQVLFKGSHWDRVVERGVDLFLHQPSAQLAFMIGTSYDFQNQTALALQWYEAAAKLCIDPSIDKYLSYAGHSAEKLQNHKKAVELYHEALRYNPNDGFHHYFLALAYDAQGKIGKAEVHFEIFLKRPEASENEEYAAYSRNKIAQFKGARFMTESVDSM
jgi:tetratricopeptide (TPR) repeat protein